MAPKMAPLGSLGSKAIATHADSMVSAGLPSDFEGHIAKARFVPYNYGGKRDYVLALRLDIESGEIDNLQPTYYSLGDRAIKDFAPSVDGEEALDLEAWDGSEENIDEVAGICLVPVGSRTALVKGSNYEHFTDTLKELGLADDLSDLRILEGRNFFWKRLPQRTRQGLMTTPTPDGQQRRANDILLPVEDRGTVAKAKGTAKAKGGSKAAAATTSAPAAAAATNGGGMDEQIEEILVNAITKAGGSMDKAKIPQAIVQNFKGNKSAAVTRAGSLEFLGEVATKFWFDPETNTLTLVE